MEVLTQQQEQQISLRLVDSKKYGIYFILNGETDKARKDFDKIAEILENAKVKVLELEQIHYPLGTNYSNNYYDGVRFTIGKTKAKRETYGGGNTWARRGSLTESWDNENVEYIDKSEVEQLINEIKEALKIKEEIDREAKLKEIVEKVLECDDDY